MPGLFDKSLGVPQESRTIPTTSMTPQTPPLATTPTGLNKLPTSQETPSGGSLVDFQRVMRAVSQHVYENRQKKEGKITGKQFDPSKVSGGTFKDIMDGVENNRGGDVSRIYSAGMNAETEQMKMDEQKRQFNIEQDGKKFETIKQKTELGIDSVYIPSGTLADRNNNPGNLKFVGQSGATMGENGFAKFNTPEDGFRALMDQVALDQSRGLTLQQFVEKYAPATENNTNVYVQQMSQWLGANPNMRLSDLDINKIAENIARKESGTQIVSASNSSNQSGIDALAVKFKQGEITAAQIPAAQRGKVIAAAENLGQQVSPEKQQAMMDNVSLVDKILANSEAISGPIQTGVMPFGEGAQTVNEYNQLQGILKLDKRSMLKGSGAISDFEFKVLGQAASSMSRLTSEKDLKQQLINVRGAFMTAAGHATRVKVSKADKSKEGELTSAEIADAIKQGYTVQYIQ